MTYRLRTGVENGRIECELGTFSIDDRIVTVDDYETAVSLVERVGHLSWADSGDDPVSPGNDGADTPVKRDSDSDYIRGDVDTDGVTRSGDIAPWAGDADDSTDDSVGDDEPSDINLDDRSYRELQEIAKDEGVKANQSTDDLREALREEIGEGE